MGCVPSRCCPWLVCPGFLSPANVVPAHSHQSGRDFRPQPPSYVMPKLPRADSLFTGKTWGTAWGPQLCLHCWVWAAVERGPMPTSSLIRSAAPWEGAGGNMAGGVGVVWGSLPGSAASSCLAYLELVPQDWVLADKTARDSPQKGPRLSWGKDRWDLWLSWAQAKLCSNCQCREMWTCGSGKLRCCHWD